MKAKLEKLSITLGARQFDFTLNEAKELQRVLNETLREVAKFPYVIEHVVEKKAPVWGPHYTGRVMNARPDQAQNEADAQSQFSDAVTIIDPGPNMTLDIQCQRAKFNQDCLQRDGLTSYVEHFVPDYSVK